MYESLDEFTGVETWISYHWADEARFFRAIHRIVNNDGFDPREVKRYLAEKWNERFGVANTVDRDRLCEHYGDLAHTVLKYHQAVAEQL